MNKSLFGFSLALSLTLILLAFSGQTSAKATRQLPQPKWGNGFQVGVFTILVREAAEGGKEVDCPKLHVAIKATLREMQYHMAPRAESLGYGTSWNILEINQKTLDLFCNKNAVVILGNQNGDQLWLHKPPFVRMVDAKTGDLGTLIYIGAAIILNGGKVPEQPDEYGRIFMPDRLLPEK